jgi:hypothetical protein
VAVDVLKGAITEHPVAVAGCILAVDVLTGAVLEHPVAVG